MFRKQDPSNSRKDVKRFCYIPSHRPGPSTTISRAGLAVMQSSETLARVDNVVQDAQKRCRDVQEHLKKALSALTTVAMNLEPGSSGPARSYLTPSKGKLQV